MIHSNSLFSGTCLPSGMSLDEVRQNASALFAECLSSGMTCAMVLCAAMILFVVISSSRTRNKNVAVALMLTLSFIAFILAAGLSNPTELIVSVVHLVEMKMSGIELLFGNQTLLFFMLQVTGSFLILLFYSGKRFSKS